MSAFTPGVGEHPDRQLAGTAWPLQPLSERYSTAVIFSRIDRSAFFGATAWWVSDIQAMFSLWLLAAFLLPLAMIDGQHQLLPDCLTQPLLWVGLLIHSVDHVLPLHDALFGAVAGYLSLWLLYWAFRLSTGREGLGYGDLKLLAALGAWCGWQALPSIVLLAALSGISGSAF